MQDAVTDFLPTRQFSELRMRSAPDFISKVFFCNRVSAGMLKGEDEYVVIGGIYEVERLA